MNKGQDPSVVMKGKEEPGLDYRQATRKIRGPQVKLERGLDGEKVTTS